MKSAQTQTKTLRRHRSAASGSVARETSLIQRVGFTLVELLMVIAIIGILIAMLSVAINPVLNRARETAVITEIQQIELAIENFNNQYGFYPPSFRTIGTPAGVLPFLNRISPNHGELGLMPGFTGTLPGNVPPTRLNVWWNEIGQNLDDSTSLVFWLSGLSSNKQFPLTFGLPAAGGAHQLPVAFNANLTTAGIEIVTAGGGTNPDREVLFDFDSGRLSDMLRTFVAEADPTDPNTFEYAVNETPLAPGLRLYLQPHGNGKGILAYAYRESAAYDGGTPADPTDDAFYSGANAGPASEFFNPRTFQLATFGLDGRGFPISTDTNNLTNQDNLTNFSQGRLDAFLNR